MIDSHCHLAGHEFRGDLSDVVARAIAGGVTGSLVIIAANDEEECARSEDVIAIWPAVRLAIGVHPHAAGQFSGDPARAAEVVETRIRGRSAARAIGEIGLDYHYDFAPRDVQQAVFGAQLRLAHRMTLPVVIHTREAEDDTFRILAESGAGVPACVLHCFTGGPEMARKALDAGCYISLAGIVTFPRALELRDVATMVPLDRLLVETDSPFLAPVPHRGTRNEPAHVVRVAETIARLRGVSLEAIGDATCANFERVFGP